MSTCSTSLNRQALRNSARNKFSTVQYCILKIDTMLDERYFTVFFYNSGEFPQTQHSIYMLFIPISREEFELFPPLAKVSRKLKTSFTYIKRQLLCSRKFRCNIAILLLLFNRVNIARRHGNILRES